MTLYLFTNDYSRISRSDLVEFILTVLGSSTLSVHSAHTRCTGALETSGLIIWAVSGQLEPTRLDLWWIQKYIADFAYDPYRRSTGTSQLYIDVFAPKDLWRHWRHFVGLAKWLNTRFFSSFGTFKRSFRLRMSRKREAFPEAAGRNKAVWSDTCTHEDQLYRTADWWLRMAMSTMYLNQRRSSLCCMWLLHCRHAVLTECGSRWYGRYGCLAAFSSCLMRNWALSLGSYLVSKESRSEAVSDWGCRVGRVSLRSWNWDEILVLASRKWPGGKGCRGSDVISTMLENTEWKLTVPSKVARSPIMGSRGFKKIIIRKMLPKPAQCEV